MTYQIAITGMHCSGCVSLITLCLEDVFGEGNVVVDQTSKLVQLKSDKLLDEVKVDLDNAFIELKTLGYEYKDLKEAS